MNNKIMTKSLRMNVFTFICLLLYTAVCAQTIPLSKFGLPYINSISIYKKSIIGHPEKQMVPVEGIPGIVLDLRYATPENFTHKRLYPAGTKSTFLRKRVFQALDSVGRDLARQGFILVIFDAYRPYSITVELWNQVKDDRYAANPAKGSGHNRGIAVDLTLADLKTHQLLSMPTDFDNFSDSAHQDFPGADVKQRANRELLKKTMEKYGFVPLSTEWWHFSWPAAGDFEVLDLDFHQLTELQKDIPAS